jgi:hypothetical protein
MQYLSALTLRATLAARDMSSFGALTTGRRLKPPVLLARWAGLRGNGSDDVFVVADDSDERKSLEN